MSVLPRNAYAWGGICCDAVSVRLSVCLSVCLSHWCIVSKQQSSELIIKQLALDYKIRDQVYGHQT